jgi:hypothetical protein
MRKNKRNEFMGTEHELLAMTRTLDEMHNDVGMPAMWAGVESVIDATQGEAFSSRSSSRRTFLLGMGGAAIGGAALLSVGAPALGQSIPARRAEG